MVPMSTTPISSAPVSGVSPASAGVLSSLSSLSVVQAAILRATSEHPKRRKRAEVIRADPPLMRTILKLNPGYQQAQPSVQDRSEIFRSICRLPKHVLHR